LLRHRRDHSSGFARVVVGIVALTAAVSGILAWVAR
jgi:hypothetical protein